jgi:hypothetical protein
MIVHHPFSLCQDPDWDSTLAHPFAFSAAAQAEDFG